MQKFTIKNIGKDLFQSKLNQIGSNVIHVEIEGSDFDFPMVAPHQSEFAKAKSVGVTLESPLLQFIQKLLREYNWNYRKKICSKCTVDTQRKLKCIQVDNSRDGIQETYCKKMTKARSQKFRKTILNYMEFHPSHNRL